MKEDSKTKDQLIYESLMLRKRLEELRVADIECKRIEESLRESEERYRMLAEASHDYIFIIDPRGNVDYVNNFASKEMGISQEEIVGKNLKDIFPKDVASRQSSNLQKVYKSGESLYVETETKIKDKTVWLDTWLIPIKDESGKVKRVFGISRDTTRRKESEDNLRAKEKFLASVFESIQDGICVLDKDMNIVRVNPTIEKWYSFAMPVVGKKCYEVFHNEPKPCDLCPTKEVLATRKSASHFVPKCGANGERIGWLDLYVYPQFDAVTGELTGVIEYARDVTEQREAEEAFELAKYSIDVASDEIYWINKDANLLYVNNRSCEALGYTKAELLEMSVFDIDPLFSKQRWNEHWKEVSDKRSLVFETQHRRKNGSVFPVEVTVNHIDYDGEEYLFAFARDITENKMVEAQLKYRINFEKLITSISTNFINLPHDKIEEGLAYAIEAIGQFSTVDRSYIFLIHDNGLKMSNTSEWCAEGVKSAKKNLQNIPVDKFPWFNEKIKKLQSIHVPKVSELSSDNNYREYLEAKKVKSLICVPLVYKGSLVGVLGFDSVFEEKTWTDDTVTLLKMVGEIFVNALERKWTEEELDKYRDHLEEIVKERTKELEREISDKNKAEETLTVIELQKEAILNNIPDMAWLKDRESRFIDVNKPFGKASGYKPKELIGKSDLDVWPKDLAKRYMEDDKKVMDLDKRLCVEEPIADKENKIKWVETIKTPLHNEKGEVIGTIGIARDITRRKEMDQELKRYREGLEKLVSERTKNLELQIKERRKAEDAKLTINKELLRSNKQLKQLALRDDQTGLYNHRYLTEIIDPEFYRARRYGHSISVIMMDIDYFKSINEVYGHRFGDYILKQFVNQINRMVRRYDIVIRYGGEEFVIVSPGINRQRAVVQAQRILDAINLYSFGNNKQRVKLKLSIGVSSYPDDDIFTGMDLINSADRILSKLKDEGGNSVWSSLDLGRKKKKIQENARVKFEATFLKDKIEKLTKKRNQSIVEAILAFAKTIELKDHYTGDHVEKTVHYATDIAKLLDMPKEDIEFIRQASMLHDLGKIGISDKILHKKGKLSPKEYDEIKKHPQIGVDIIRPIQFLHDIIPLMLYHHERWDGKGYPAGLKGKEIPMGARVIAIADVYQALTSNRPYRKAYSNDKAIKIIKESSGTQFDPEVVDALIKIIRKRNGNVRRKR